MKCMRVGCDAEATHLPILSFAASPGGVRTRGELGAPVCEEHASTDLAMWISDVGWDQICNSVVAHGYARPDRTTVSIDFILLS